MLAFAGVASLMGVATAQAQSMSTNSADFNAGYGRRAGSENHAVNVSTRDANGNRVIIAAPFCSQLSTGPWPGWLVTMSDQ